MKLKKIIPLAGIASVAAITTPLIASCSSITRIEWNWGDELPPLEPIQRNYQWSNSGDEKVDATANIAEIEKATSDYFNDLSKDSSIFAKDVLYFLSNWPWYENAAAEIQKISVQVNSINTNNWTISYEVNFQGKMEGPSQYDEYEVHVRLQNVKFYVLPVQYMPTTPISDYISDGTMVAPLIFQYGDFTIYSPFEMMLQERVRKLLVDNSWFIEYQINNTSQSTGRSARIDKTNVTWWCLEEIRHPEGGGYPYEWINGSTIIKSTHLDLNWEII